MFNSSNHKRQKRKSRKNKRLAGCESLEARQLLTATTLPYVALSEFNQFTGGAPASFGFGIDDGPGGISEHEPRFLGFGFDEDMRLGGVTDPGPLGGQWGAEGYFEGEGRLGLEYGYYVNGAMQRS